MPIEEPRRVLAVRVGRMGDLVMLTPALRLLLTGLPGAELHLLTTTEGRRTLRGFDPRLVAFHLYRRRFPAGLLSDGATRRALAALAFDRVYVFETNPRYARLMRGVAPDVRVLEARPRSLHFSARCLDLAEDGLARPAARGWLELPVTDAGRRAASDYLAAHGVGPGEIPVGLHLTFSESGRGALASGRRHREWPAAEAAALARRLAAFGESAGLPIRPVIDALPAERPLAEALRRRSGGALTVLSGPPDFERYKALLARLRVLVTPNTGPMHVAAAVGTPVVALFSGWSPDDCGPFVPEDLARVLRAEETGRAALGLAAIGADAAFEATRPFLTRA